MLFTRILGGTKDPYPLIKLPVRYSSLNTSVLGENTAEDWDRYKKWFLTNKAERIAELELEVHRTSGFEDWQADFSRESIVNLSTWFARAVSARPPTRAEKKWILEHIPDGPSREMSLKYQLDEKTMSLCFDVGMYLGDTLIRHHAGLKWKQLKGRHAWAGMMAITGELRHDPASKPAKDFPIEPVASVRVVAAHTIEKHKSASIEETFNRILATYEPYRATG